MFLGVDGGGTKTAFCLIDTDGQVPSRCEMSGCSYLTDGIKQLENILAHGIEQVCVEAKIVPKEIEYAFFGIPCYGESSRDLTALDEVPAQLLSHRRYRCDNDMVCGWAGSLGGKDGINVIAGTGSMTYGENAGRKFRCGGWGELIGDEGSAYWIATRGLAAFTRMSDGRLRKGILYDKIRMSFHLSKDLDLVGLVSSEWGSNRSKIASICTIVADAANNGGTCALGIFRQAASELVQLVETTRYGLAFRNEEEVEVSYSGGVFKAKPGMEQLFRDELSKHKGNYVVRDPLFPPVIGAAIYAAKLNRTPIENELLIKQRIQNLSIPKDKK